MQWGMNHCPRENELEIIHDSKENAICIIETTKVEVIPFKEVSENHAYKEGEGDRRLTIGESFTLGISLANGCMRLDYILVRTV